MSPWAASPSLVFRDRLLERWNCLCHIGCPGFNRNEDALEPWIVLILEKTYSLETDVNFSVHRHVLSIHVSKIGVMHFAIFQCNKLDLFF